jgi:hypothetical protein
MLQVVVEGDQPEQPKQRSKRRAAVVDLVKKDAS